MVVMERELPQHGGVWGRVRARNKRRFERGERGGRGDPQCVNCCRRVRVGEESRVDADGVGKEKWGEGGHVWEDEGCKFRKEDCVGFEELE